MSDWQLHHDSRELEVGGVRQRISEKPFRVLVALVNAGGRVVTRADLQAQLWSDDTFVDFENNLNSAVASLRQAFGDTAKNPTFIETIPKVGYRLKVLPSPPRAHRRHWVWGAAAAAVVLAAGTMLVPTGQVVDRDARTLVERGRYLRGQFEATRQSPELLEQALEAFVRAETRAPDFADASAEEAETRVAMSFAGLVGFREGLANARHAATRALNLDPTHQGAARSMAVATMFVDWDTASARRWLDRAASPASDAKASMAWAMWFAATGQPDSAVDAAERAVALDPESYFVRSDLAMFYLVAGRNTDAAEAAAQVLAVAPGFRPARAYALLAHERLGEWAEAAGQARALMREGQAPPELLARANAVGDREAVTLWRRWDLDRVEARAKGRRQEFALELALRHSALGDRTTAIRELAQALEARNALLIFLRAYPELTPLRGDPSFEAIVRKVSDRG